jgi:hypothetical protein
LLAKERPLQFVDIMNGARIGILISGQLFRIMYNEQNVPGGLFPLVCGKLPSCAFDVYLTLADTKAPPWKGSLELARSRSDISNTDATQRAITQYYSRQGANHVEINILTAHAIDDLLSVIETKVAQIWATSGVQISELYRNTSGSSNCDGCVISNYILDFKYQKTCKICDLTNLSNKINKPILMRRWEPHGRMMLLRHLVYSQMIVAERELPYNYSHVLYLREDNVFWRQSPTHSSLDAIVQRVGPSQVAVDAHCGFGSYSDKLYLAGRAAANVLFSSTLDRHASRMLQWLLWGHSTRPSMILQTEAFLQRLLESEAISVVKWDFIRTDLRYGGSTMEPCIQYGQSKCTGIPNGTFKICPKR